LSRYLLGPAEVWQRFYVADHLKRRNSVAFAAKLLLKYDYAFSLWLSPAEL